MFNHCMRDQIQLQTTFDLTEMKLRGCSPGSKWPKNINLNTLQACQETNREKDFQNQRNKDFVGYQFCCMHQKTQNATLNENPLSIFFKVSVWPGNFPMFTKIALCCAFI